MRRMRRARAREEVGEEVGGGGRTRRGSLGGRRRDEERLCMSLFRDSRCVEWEKEGRRRGRREERGERREERGERREERGEREADGWGWLGC